MWKFKEKNTISPLVLADFEDGSWHATSFAVEFLWKKQHQLFILQTFERPDFGHFMNRNLRYKLKEITLNELRKLKNKLVFDRGIAADNVETLSIEGELSKVLQHSSEFQGDFNLVLSTHSNFKESCRMQNRYLEKLINTTKFPIFILPKEFNMEQIKKVLFVGNTTRIPSTQLVNRITEICKATNATLDVLFISGKKQPKVTENIKSKYIQCFDELKVSLHQTEHSSTCKGMNNYIKHAQQDLIIIENK